MRDSAGHGLGDAQVAIPALNLVARTNFNGEFRIDRVPAGRHRIVIRHVGFAGYDDSITAKAGQIIDDEFILVAAPVNLDSQVVVAGANRVEPNLREFEERRKLGFGHFIDKAELAKVEGGRPLMNFIVSRIPGLSIYRPDEKDRPLDYYISSGRGPTASSTGHCPVVIYMDGVAWFTPRTPPRLGDPPDVGKFSAEEFAGIEYYPPGGSVPSRYVVTQNGCGTLLFWRRYR